MVELPPLRTRAEDIPALAEEILRTLGPQHLSAEALSKLGTYPFPGNIRELKSILQRATLSTDNDIIDVQDLGLIAPAVAEKSDF
jgi:DNA-binding NtrC family response regulator